MSNYENNRSKREEQRKNKRQTREIMAKYFLDLSKMVLTAVTFGVLAPWLIDHNVEIDIMVAVVGLVASISLAIFGYKIINTK